MTTSTVKSLNEPERLAALKKYNILDTPPDGSFDRVTRMAARLLQVPIAIVTLVDTDRIWFKSRYGLDIQQLDREPGLCASAIMSDGVYMVEDAMVDSRTLANPLVAGAFGLRFYAAAPLKTRDGYNLGTLCVIDKHPRRLTPEEAELLQDLADTVMDQIELRMAARIAVARQNRILYIAAHDLKNPLTTITMRADLIKRGKQDFESLYHLGDQIKEAGLRMTSTINELLEAASLDTAGLKLHLIRLDVTDLVRKVVMANQALADHKNQTIDVQIRANPVIRADESKLIEMVDNLVNNAIKYSPPGSNIRVIIDSTVEWALISVNDEGPGLTDEDKEQLFLPFSKLSAKPTAGEHSSGLGLSIVKVLAEAHEGSVYAQSEGPGRGATFTIQLPLALPS